MCCYTFLACLLCQRQVDSKASYNAAMADNERAVAVRIKALQQNNVNLVICTEPISDMASHLLSQVGIAAVQVGVL